jgi:hypothetical protein
LSTRFAFVVHQTNTNNPLSLVLGYDCKLLIISFFLFNTGDTVTTRKRKELPTTPPSKLENSTIPQPNPDPFLTPAKAEEDPAVYFPFSEEIPRLRVLPKRHCRDASSVPQSRSRRGNSLFDIIMELKEDSQSEPS